MIDKKLIFADVDGCLCESRQRISLEMKKEVERITEKYTFACIGGNEPKQLYTQICKYLNVPIYVLGNSGTKISKWDGKNLEQIFSDDFSQEDKAKIKLEVEALCSEFNLIPFIPKDDQILDRDTQITLAILGSHAPLNIRRIYDSDKIKRKKFINWLRKKLPEFELVIGGTTSIDITKKERNKGWGIVNFCKTFNYNLKECLFFGDAIFPEENDYSVVGLIDYIKIQNPKDTLEKFRELL